MYIAIEGQDPMDQKVRAVVLLDMNEAADLYEDLRRVFEKKDEVVASKVEAVPLTPFPTIDVSPLKKDPAPGTERQKTLADYLREMEERRKTEPYKPFEYVPPFGQPNPVWPTTPYKALPDVWCGNIPINPKFTAAATVDFKALAENQKYLHPSNYPETKGPQ